MERLRPSQGRRPRGGAERLAIDYLERVIIAVLVPERDVFVGREDMRLQMEAGLVVLHRVLVVVDQPGGAAAAAGPVEQTSMPVRLAGPEAANVALGPLLLPLLRVETARSVEGHHEFVAVAAASGRMFTAAG